MINDGSIAVCTMQNASYMHFYVWPEITSIMISKSYLNYILRNPKKMIVNLGPAAPTPHVPNNP